MALFAIHTIVGVFIFVILGSAAVMLHYIAEFIAASGVSPYIVLAVQALEFFLFAIDFMCMVVFVVREAWIFLREIVA